MTGKLSRIPLASGISLSIIEDKKFKSNRLSINLVTPMNGDYVSDYAILPYLLRRGCKSLPDFTKLNRRLDELYGACLFTDVGKAGANQIITLSIAFIDDRFTLKGETLTKQCTRLLCDVLTGALIEGDGFVQSELELERRNLIDTIEAAINDKRSYAVGKCRQLMGRGDPSAIRRYGTVEGAKAITPQSAAVAYYRLLKEAQIEIIFVGPGNHETAAEVIKEAFSTLSRDPLPIGRIKATQSGETPLEQVEKLDVAQSKLVLGLRMGEISTDREHAACRLMSALYGGTPSSKLFLNVREKLSLCYYCAARYDRAGAILLVDCGVESENIKTASQEILNQLEAIRQNDFEDETIANTKALLKNALESVGDSPSSLEDWYLQRIVMGNVSSPQEELLRLEAVTREEIVWAAKAAKLDAVYLLTGKAEEE